MNAKLIIGLGNPGPKHENNRHNAGFMMANALAEKFASSFINEKRFEAETSAFDLGDNRIILVKPQTFMNDSGKAVSLIKTFFKIENQDIVVVHDEIDLPLGKIRLSFDASAAGHNGVRSIIEKIGQDFHRLRIGIESRASRLDADTHDYVLTNFTAEEKIKLKKEIIPAAVSEIEKFLK